MVFPHFELSKWKCNDCGVTYGYRDGAYFFLKIRSAFPGIPG